MNSYNPLTQFSPAGACTHRIDSEVKGRAVILHVSLWKISSCWIQNCVFVANVLANMHHNLSTSSSFIILGRKKPLQALLLNVWFNFIIMGHYNEIITETAWAKKIQFTHIP